MGRDLQALWTRLLMLTNAVFACLAALVALALAGNPLAFAPEGAPLPTGGVFAQIGALPVRWAAFVGGIVLALNILWILYGRTPRQPLQFVVSEGASGPIRIARDAIVSGLQRAGEELDEVSRVRVGLESQGLRRIIVQASFQAPEGVVIEEAGQRLRSTLAGAFFDLVRLGDDRRLDVVIEFTGRSGRLARRKDDGDSSDEVPEQPFTGPQYPIDDSEDPYRDRP
jgi:hypothetical protein